MGRRTCGQVLAVSLVVGIAAGGCSSAATQPRTSINPSPSAAASSVPRLPATAVEPFPGTVILGSPTDRSIKVSIAADTGLEVFVEHGRSGAGSTARTATATLEGGVPLVFTLDRLEPDTAWSYRIWFRPTGQGEFRAASDASFHTQRAVGSAFTFAVEADPHIGFDDKASPDLFRAELANVRDAGPDFLIDLGDTFMGDKVGRQGASIESVYASLRAYFGIAGPSVPLYLVNGNHDGEAGWSLAEEEGSVAAQATTARRTYFPNPASESFYDGGATDAAVGLRDSSYAWTWGDALFVVLDPYSATARKPGTDGDPWGWTLGETQYRWLAEVLRSSTSPYKFVFAHHLIGDVRGGIEQAGRYEWGGRDADGTPAFDEHRPGWGMPIHDLLVKAGVTIFFQGHDHLYAREELDGVVYQTVPQPATLSGNPDRMAAEYGYRTGVILGSPGHLEVTVAPAGVTVDYVHAGTGDGDRSGFGNGETVSTYTVWRPTR